MIVPFISIITPTYNHEQYIEKCIVSVISQSYSNWEMIIINDGSTDNTETIIEKYLSDTRIKYIYQENIGVFRLNETYNKALQYCRGEYIAILEGDDWWEKNKLQMQIDALKNDSEAVVVWGKAANVSHKDGNIIRIMPDNRQMLLKENFNNNPIGCILNVLFENNCLPALTLLINKKALIDLGGFAISDNLPMVDYPTLFKLSTMGRFIYVDSILGSWNKYDAQTTQKYKVEIGNAVVTLFQSVFNELPLELRKKISLSDNKLKMYCDLKYITTYASYARYCLLHRNFEEARLYYKKILFYNNGGFLIWRLKSIVGYIFACLNTDFEFISKSIGRNSYK